MIRKLIHIAFAALLTGVVMAQDVSVRSDHPDEYIVVEGDTLWDISGRFLDKPWQWPAIWHANPQIANPHLIYPGDIVSLVYIDGVPQLRLRRGDTIKLSPSVRVVDRDAPINAISFASIMPFIRDFRVLSPSEFEGLPYILANNEDRMTATFTDQTYARGLNGQVGEEFVVVRLTSIYDAIGDPPETRRVRPQKHWKTRANVWDHSESIWDTTHPWNHKAKNPVGYEMIEVSRVRVSQAGEISVLDIIRDRTEVKEGDFILPVSDIGYENTFFPRAMDSVPDGLRILATSGQKVGVGTFQIVSINGGGRQGLQSGHVFAAFRRGEEVRDSTGHRYGSFHEDAKVRLPEVFDGLVMVFRTFDEISYGIVMSGSTRVVQEFDRLRHPDERL
ncbi:MAG: LysM peptidoglycan-binding domain-containing protein [Xanthomonadales bacterium]